MEETARVGRKRLSSASSDGHSDGPKAKKKKRSVKGKQGSSSDTPSVPDPKPSLPPSTAKPTSQRVAKSVSAPKLASSKAPSKVEAKLEDGTASTSNSKVDTSSTPTSDGHVKKTKAKPKNYCFKPHNGSWMGHIGSAMVYRFVSQAVEHSFDPRDHLNDIDFSLMSERLLSAQDMKLTWLYIKREFPNASLSEILTTLQPYSKLTVEQFTREDIKEKYKDQIPKPPASAYMLFSKSKGPKLKAKHPKLSITETAVKLGKKWRSMATEKQEKYRQQYAGLKKMYESQLQKFYADHPDAKPPTPPPSNKKKRKGQEREELSPEEKKIQELKLLLPKQPMTAYLLFCKAKREKLHRKHPELNPREVTVKLGQRWRTMGEKKAQLKYKTIYEQNSRAYQEQLQEFHASHPEAKELLALARKKNKKGKSRASGSTKVSTQEISEEDTSPALPPIVEERESEEEEEEVRDGESVSSEPELKMDLSDGGKKSSSGSEDSSDDSEED